MAIDDNDVNWDAMMRARYHYMETNNIRPGVTVQHPWMEGYQIWLHNEWGIDHYATRIDIINKQKYALFLLKFA